MSNNSFQYMITDVDITSNDSEIQFKIPQNSNGDNWKLKISDGYFCPLKESYFDSCLNEYYYVFISHIENRVYNTKTWSQPEKIVIFNKTNQEDKIPLETTYYPLKNLNSDEVITMYFLDENNERVSLKHCRMLLTFEKC
jgi:hypothetical protein